jgi:predicted O-linked N-acetylglucosamine transferase (SPINDLY family)
MPGHARAHLNLGTVLEALDDAQGAMESYRSVLAVEPANAAANYNLGRLLLVRGSVGEAAGLLQEALKHRPGFPEALVALANVYESQGDLKGAAGALEEALASRGEWTGVLANYAGVLKKLGRPGEAEAVLRRLLKLEPANVDALYELANLLYVRRDLAEAARLLRIALQYRPQFAEAYGMLFHVQEAEGDLESAAATLATALSLYPDWAEALHNHGTVLRKLRRLAEAEQALLKAIALAPNLSLAHEALGGVFFNQSRVAEALDCYRRAREIEPGRLELLSTELFVLNHADGVSADALCELHHAAGRRLEAAYPARFHRYRSVQDPERRLRVGYVSGDFNHHPVTFFLLPLLDKHDRNRFEIACYSVGTSSDTVTSQVSSRADIWRECAAMTTNELADTIYGDGIDILVDLSGHSGTSRLGVFAQQPAPVQIAWLGYPNTTGLSRIQYRISDPYTDPPGETDALYSEQLVRLSCSQWCYRPPLVVAGAPVPPVQRNGYVTFGSFNQLRKLSPGTRRLWAHVLSSVPASRLVVAGIPDERDRQRFLVEFHSAGVEKQRVSFLAHGSIHEYFRRIGDVDIALDPTPYSGCTTSFDTLWMGVPIITLTGAAPASRTTAAILAMMGCNEWIARDAKEYIGIAEKFSLDCGRLAALRQGLRQALLKSPIMDEPRFALDMEGAYRKVWSQWCSGISSG